MSGFVYDFSLGCQDLSTISSAATQRAQDPSRACRLQRGPCHDLKRRCLGFRLQDILGSPGEPSKVFGLGIFKIWGEGVAKFPLC